MSVEEAKKKTAKAVFLRLACVSSIKGLKTRLCTTQNKRMHIVSTLIGVDGFQVDHVADHVVLIVNAVTPVHVAGHASDVQSLAAAVAFNQADHFWNGFSFVHESTHAQAGLQTQTDFGLHVGQLLLNQLILGKRATKLNAVHGVLASTVPAVFCSAQSAPSNAVTGFVQAAEGALQT